MNTLLNVDGSLSALACEVLHAVSGVRMDLLQAARIRRARQNWLRAPWYGYHRGGAITVGRTIWFTRKWFRKDGFGDGSIESTWRWMLHLAHEVGHLEQAARFGLNFQGKVRYVAAFVGQYSERALLLKRDVHDGAPLEQEADRGRWVLARIIGNEPHSHPLVQAMHTNDATAMRELLRGMQEGIAAAHNEYATKLDSSIQG